MLLRGASGAALALPLLNDVLPASAATPPFPKRFVVVFTPNGTLPDAFFGPGDPNNLVLGNILTPLAPHKDALLVLDGLDAEASRQASGDPHGVGVGCMLSGRKLLTGAEAQGMSSGGWSSGISIDQHIATEVGKTTKMRSLDLAGKNIAGSIFSRLSYAGSAQPVTPEADPQRAFDRVFGQVVGDQAAIARRRALKKSILDEVTGELDGLAGKLSAADRQKVQAHAAALRDLEMRLDKDVTVGGSCVPPMRPDVMQSNPVGFSPYDPNNAGHEVINAADDVTFPKIIKAQFETMARALACDITRVATLMAAPSRSDVVMTWLGIQKAHHEASHIGEMYPEAIDLLTRINTWYAQQISDFITTLKSIPEGAGTVFDNTVILWCNELGLGGSHTHTRIPFLLAGKCGGYFKTGRYVQFPAGTFHNNLLASLSLAMGVPLLDGKFGDPAFCTGPLPGLTA
jgi:hypothetical protein